MAAFAARGGTLEFSDEDTRFEEDGSISFDISEGPQARRQLTRLAAEQHENHFLL
jgi:hypothetical protein